MKKILLVIFINLALIFAIILTAEHFAYTKTLEKKYEHSKVFIVDKNKPKPFWRNEMLDFENEYNESLKYDLRKPVGLEYKKPPIVLFGCSFTYGYRLNDEQTFGAYLSKLSKRPVYNRAFNAWGFPHMVYQLSRDDFYREVKEPEYVIYVFSKNQMQMMYDYTFQLWDEAMCLRYKLSNGKLVKVKNPPKFIRGFYLLKFINQKMARKVIDCNFSQKDEELAIAHFKTAKESALKHWKNTKFVVLLYDQTPETEWFDEKFASDLKKNGFIVLKMDDIAGFKVYDAKFQMTENDPHPSERLWQLFTPKLVKTLGL